MHYRTILTGTRQRLQEKDIASYVGLIHKAFRERLDAGIVTIGSRISEDSLRKLCASSVLFVAEDDNLSPLGLLILSGEKDGYIEIVAVSPEHKSQGIGSKLLELAEKAVQDRGGSTIFSDTGIAMKSSVKWHLKNGFKKSSLLSFASTDYYSYEFRKDLVPRTLGFLRSYMHFLFYCIKTPLAVSSARRPSKKLTLKEIQQESLNILNVVHQFCVEHNIRYSLAYGSLIGAVRHKGFIPWDDDIDIIMPRPDYDRFLQTFTYDGLGLLSSYSKSSYILYSRVYDYAKTMVKTRLPFARDYKGGIWIDIFPADCVEDDFCAFKSKIPRLKTLYQKQMFYRVPTSSFSVMPTMKKKLGLLKRKVLRLNGWPLKKSNGEMDKIIRSIPWGSTSHWSQMACMDEGEKMYQPIEDFDNLMSVPFEDKEFLIFKNYDQELRRIYGDYMQLPPLSEREPKQTYIDFYWIP